MTPDELTALGRRAVACKHWAWRPGMATTDGSRIGRVNADSSVALIMGTPFVGGPLPDLSDPGTLGCVLALVRRAWGDPHICTRSMTTCIDGENWAPGPWRVASTSAHLIGIPLAHGQTEAEALIAALEAAP